MKIFELLLSSSAVVLVGSARACRDSEWSCDRHLCISKRWLCDGDPDCNDGSDEKPENCPAPSGRNPVLSCRSSEFKCGNGNCIPMSWRCDKADDCRDNSDEVGCESNCSDGEFQCKSNQQCIAKSLRCDGSNDCEDASDEVNCISSTTALPDHMFHCSSGVNIPKKWVCDGEADCIDNSDEKDCAGVSPEPKGEVPNKSSICRENEFQCGSYCIMKAWVCDGTEDCLHGEDEAQCQECSHNQFQCADKRQCIPNNQWCDAKKNCEDGSDEDNCPTSSPDITAHCNLTTHFMCRMGRCIEQGKLCDGKNNCGDKEDESEQVCGVNECERNNGGCTHKCINTREGYYCTCDSGYRLIGKYTCEDINECEEVPGICSQTCTNRNGGYHCSCLPGYLRDTRNYTRCKAATGEAFLLFTHRHDIRSLRLKDSEMTAVVTDTRGATALDYMFSSHQIVWSDNKANEILRANLSNPEVREVLVKGERICSDGLAVDWIHKNIYYADTGNFKIHMVNWDATCSRTIVNEKLGQPRAVAVSPLDGYIFWSDWGTDPKIERAGLDGHDRTPIVESPHVFWPNGVTIDHSNNHIYWCDGKLSTISRANLDGSQIEVILYSTSVLKLPYSISVFEDRVYWTDWSHMALHSANKFNGGDIMNISAGHVLEVPKAIHVYHENRQPKGENVCAFNQCSHMCVRSTTGTPLCICPDGLLLSTMDSRTCLDNDYEEIARIISTQAPDISSENLAPTAINPGSNEDYSPTTAERSILTPDEPLTGMIVGVTLGSTVILLLALVAFVGIWKSRQGGVKRMLFHNPVYRKTTDEEMDDGGFTIRKKNLLYNPMDYKYTEGPDVPTCDDDDVFLTPKK